MFRLLVYALTFAVAIVATPAPAGESDMPAQVAAPAAKKLECTNPDAPATASTEDAKSGRPSETSPANSSPPKVLFKLNTAEDAPTILRFVTNYLAVEPTAKVAVVGYAGGIDFMLEGARDANGTLYAEQLAALAARGVEFKVCNNTLKARNLTAAAVNPVATVVPGAVNEIIRLQTKEGYAYFQN